MGHFRIVGIGYRIEQTHAALKYHPSLNLTGAEASQDAET